MFLNFIHLLYINYCENFILSWYNLSPPLGLKSANCIQGIPPLFYDFYTAFLNKPFFISLLIYTTHAVRGKNQKISNQIFQITYILKNIFWVPPNWEICLTEIIRRVHNPPRRKFSFPLYPQGPPKHYGILLKVTGTYIFIAL